MGSCSRHGESHVAVSQRRQGVYTAHENRLTITGVIGWAGGRSIKTPRPSPLVVRRFGMVLPTEFLFLDLVKLLRQKFVITLVGLGIRRRIQLSGYRLLYRRDIEFGQKRRRLGAGWIRRQTVRKA